MSKAIGMVEYRTVSTGVQAADIMQIGRASCRERV